MLELFLDLLEELPVQIRKFLHFRLEQIKVAIKYLIDNSVEKLFSHSGNYQ